MNTVLLFQQSEQLNAIILPFITRVSLGPQLHTNLPEGVHSSCQRPPCGKTSGHGGRRSHSITFRKKICLDLATRHCYQH
jgi:hypothetical protein